MSIGCNAAHTQDIVPSMHRSEPTQRLLNYALEVVTESKINNAKSHLTRRLFKSMVRRIEALPLPAE